MAGDIHFAGETTNRSDFELRARIIASALIAQGINPDETIAILVRNDVAYLEIIQAARFVGVRFATINWHAAPSEVHHILSDSGARVLFAHADLLEHVIDGIPESVTPIAVSQSTGHRMSGVSDFADILAETKPYEGDPLKFRGLFPYTSGSTGRPKGIKRLFDPDGPDAWDRYKGLASTLMAMKPGDKMYVSAPLYHSAPNALSSMTIALGDVDLYLEPKFDPEGFLSLIDSEKITHAYVVPTMMVRLLKLDEDIRTRYDVSSLRFTLSTGSPFPMSVKKEMIEWFGPVFNESYGASEIGFMTLISSEEALQKPGSVGRVLPGGEVKVLDDNLKEVPTGEVGSLYISLPQFGDFQYTNAEGDLRGQRAGAFTSVGDMGYLDDDGYIYISDRKKDMIISGGANIFPAEIEAQLIVMPEIADCAVFGAPDEEFGEAIVAAVVCRPGASVSLDDVRGFLEPRLAKFKIPRKVDVHKDLPRQESGKIFKAKLRAPYWEGAGRQV